MTKGGAVLVLAAAMILSMAAAPARASNFGSTRDVNGYSDTCGFEIGNSGWKPVLTVCVVRANNRYHAVRLSYVGNQWPGMDTAVTSSLANDYNPTDLVAYVDNSDPYPDVIVYDYYYYGTDVGRFGWVDCPADNTGVGGAGSYTWCRGQKLRINASGISRYRNTSSTRLGLACHELGHTLGLRHRSTNGTCSDTDGVTNSAGLKYWNPGLASHEINHLNWAY